MFTIVKNPNGTCEVKIVPDGNDVYTSYISPITEIANMITSREGTLLTEDLTVKADSIKSVVGPFEIKVVQSNRAKNVFTVAWKDGTVTSVHCQPGDDWDDEKALAMCFTKKALGNKGNFNDKFNDALAHMKTIPAHEEKTIPAIPAADATNAMADALTRLTENAHETAKNIGETLVKKLEKSGLTEKIDELCASASPVKTGANPWPKKSEIALCKKDLGHRYNVYLYGIFTESNKFLFRAKTIEEVRQFISKDSKARGHGFYSRLWNGKENDLYIDYGSHTHYYHITGTNIEEYAYN
jgi:hypothetical protein